MRMFIVAGAIATLGIAVLAVPASASFDHHFSVLSKTTSAHQAHHRFTFKDKLLDPQNRQNRVGRDHGVCKIRHNSVSCQAIVHLSGEIGGFGDIRVRGNLRRHDDRLNVTGGTDDFNAVGGKVLVHTLNRRVDRLHFDLVR